MSNIVFPLNPIHGQTFIDPFNIRWIYDITEDAWIEIGPVLNVPLAKSGHNCA